MYTEGEAYALVFPRRDIKFAAQGMKDAIITGDFRAYFQPILSDNETVGFEALAGQ